MFPYTPHTLSLWKTGTTNVKSDIWLKDEDRQFTLCLRVQHFFWICFVWAPYKTCSDCVSHHHLSFFVSNLGAVFNGLAHVTLWGQASYAQYNDHDIFVFFRVKCRCCFVWFSSCNPVRVSSFRPKKRPRLLTQKIEPRDFRHLTKKWGPTFYPLSTCSAFLYKFCFVWAPW